MARVTVVDREGVYQQIEQPCARLDAPGDRFGEALRCVEGGATIGQLARLIGRSRRTAWHRVEFARRLLAGALARRGFRIVRQ